MEKYFQYIIILLSFFISQAQTKQLDSIKNLIKTTDSLELKASLHGRVAWLNFRRDLNASQTHLDSSRKILAKLNYPKGVAKLNYRYAVLYRLKGEYDKALSYVEQSYEYNFLQKDSFAMANDLFQKGVINSIKGDYKTSLETYYQILEIYESSSDTKGIGMTLNSIGIVQKNLKQYDGAITSYKRAIGTLENTKHRRDLANSYGNLGSAFFHKKQLDSALSYLKIARQLDKGLDDLWGIAINSYNIGEIFIYKKDYQTALTYLEEAYQIQKRNNYETALAETRTALGKVYLKLNQFSKSEKFLNAALEQAPESKKTLRELEYNLYDLYKKQRIYSKALSHHETFFAYNDSILSKENTEYANELEVKFETEKKDKELAEQQLEIEQQELELQKKQSQYKLMTGLVIFLLISSLLTWFLYQQRQKRKNQEIVTLKREQQVKTLELLMEGEEKERFRIAKELHDGVNVDLSAIKYKLTSLLEKNNEVINEAVTMIDKSCEQVRAISHNLVPPALKDFTLVEAIEDYCSTTNAIHETKVTFQHIGNTVELSKKADANIFRIVQELVNNSIKHAEASEIDVQISYQNDSIQLTVEDNGKGYDINAEKSNGIGLQNIKSRIAYLNAKLDVTSDSKGTSYIIDININAMT